MEKLKLVTCSNATGYIGDDNPKLNQISDEEFETMVLTNQNPGEVHTNADENEEIEAMLIPYKTAEK